MSEHNPKQLQAHILAAAPDLELSFRPMFGGIMAYLRGVPFASLSNVGLALKFAGAAGDAARAEPGASPLRYEPDSPPSKSYVLVPEAMLRDSVRLREWIDKSAAVLGAKPVRHRKKSPDDRL